jgi:hypothetical protein
MTEAVAHWQVVIFIVAGKANHCGLSIPGLGLADNSLLGARVVPWSHDHLPKGDRAYYDLVVPNPDAALAFLRRPGMLCRPILEQERAFRGWHLTVDAPDFVRTLRSARSRDPNDMNCVEWIVHALELGGVPVPMSIMTPTELRQWCLAGCPAGEVEQWV